MDSVASPSREALAEARAQNGMQMPKELKAFWVASLVGFALAFVIGWFKWHAGQSRFNWDPLSDPLFGDLSEYPGTYQLLHTSAFFNNVPGRPWPYPMFSPVAYPPFAAVVMAPLYAAAIPELLYLVVAAFWIAAAVWWVRSALLHAGLNAMTALLLPLSVAVVSFPIARLVHQGNVELVLWMFTAAGVWTFMRGWDDTAAVLWGLAAAMKLFPLVLLALLLPRRKWRAFFAGLTTFVAATVLSLWWLGPSVGVAWHGSIRNVFGYQGVRVGEWSLRELVANHSLMELVKIAGMMMHIPLGKLTLPYFVVGAVALAAAFFGKLWRMPVANQLLGVSAFMMMFPPISYYHALVNLYAPLIVLGSIAVRAQRSGVHVRGLRGTMLLFVPLFVPFTVLTFRSVLLFCGTVQSVVLAVLFLRALEYRFEVHRTAALVAV